MSKGTAVGVIVGIAALCLIRVPLGHAVHVIIVLLGVGAITMVPAVVVHADRHRRLVRQLYARSCEASLDDTIVRVADLDGAVFVAGLGRPTIFCDREVPRRLSTGQLRAVLLHERAHQRSHDPLKLVLLNIAAPVLRRLPGGQQRLANTIARREIAADRYAVTHGATRSDLAAALLTLPPMGPREAAGFTSAVDQRLQALLSDTPDRGSFSGHPRLAWPTINGSILGAFLCVAIVHPALNALTGP